MQTNLLVNYHFDHCWTDLVSKLPVPSAVGLGFQNQVIWASSELFLKMLWMEKGFSMKWIFSPQIFILVITISGTYLSFQQPKPRNLGRFQFSYLMKTPKYLKEKFDRNEKKIFCFKPFGRRKTCLLTSSKNDHGIQSSVTRHTSLPFRHMERGNAFFFNCHLKVCWPV